MLATFFDRATLSANISITPISQSVDTLNVFSTTAQSDVLARSQDAQVLITNKTEITKAHMDALQGSLQLICSTATGFNHIDVDAARDLGITVTNVPAYSTQSVAQHTFALMLNLATNCHRYTHKVQTGQWSESDYFCLNDDPITELAGKTLGIVGYGDIGKAVANIARAFGMNVLLANLRPDQDYPESRLPLDALLPQVDYLSLHCPLTPVTTNLLNAQRFALMKQTAVVINTARGPIINEADLVQALKTGQIAGAGLDVLSTEPPPADTPLLQLKHPRLLITPHTAWASQESQNTLVQVVANNIQAYRAGQPQNVVNG